MFAGFAITTHFTSFFPTSSIASPYSLKMFAFFYNKSFLSIPGSLGKPPRNTNEFNIKYNQLYHNHERDL